MSHDQRRNADRGTRSTKFDHIRRAGLGFGAYLIGIVASAALVGTLSAPTAQAQTLPPINTTDQLFISAPGCSPLEITGDWYNYAFDPSFTDHQFIEWNSQVYAESEFNYARDGGYWGIRQRGVDQWIDIFWRHSTLGYPELNYNPSDETYYFDNNFSYISVYMFQQQSAFPCQTYVSRDTELTNGTISDVHLAHQLYAYNGNYSIGSTIPEQIPTLPGIPGGDDGSIFDQWDHDPENMPTTENEDCDWWDFSCWTGTLDFNPLRDAAEEAAGNFGFIAQLGGIFEKIVETLTVMPSTTNLPGYDACGSPAADWCKVDLEILDGSGEIDFHKWRNNPMMEVLQPWLLLITIGGMAWVIFKSVVGIIERVTNA